MIKGDGSGVGLKPTLHMAMIKGKDANADDVGLTTALPERSLG